MTSVCKRVFKLASNLEKFHEHSNGYRHHKSPCFDKHMTRSIAEVSFTDRAVFNTVLEDGAGVNCSTLLCTWTRNLFRSRDCYKKKLIYSGTFHKLQVQKLTIHDTLQTNRLHTQSFFSGTRLCTFLLTWKTI